MTRLLLTALLAAALCLAGQAAAQPPQGQGFRILDPVRAMAGLKAQNAPPGAYWELLDSPSRLFAALHPDLFEAFLADFPTAQDLTPLDFEPDGPSFLVETAGGKTLRVAPDAATGDYRVNLTR